MIKSIISGFGRTLGRFLFYVLLGLLAYLIFDNWEVKAIDFVTNVQFRQTINTGYRELNVNIVNNNRDLTIDIIDHGIYCDTAYCLVVWSYAETSQGYIVNQTEAISSDYIHLYYIASTTNSQGPCLFSDGKIQCVVPNAEVVTGIYFTALSPNNSYAYFTNSFDLKLGVGAIGAVYNIIDNSTSMSTLITNTQNINTSLNDDTTLPSSDISSITDIGIGSDITGNARFSDIVLLAPNVLHHLLIDSNTCVQVNLGQLYNTNLYLPCILPVNYLGTSIWGVIDVIFCIALIIPFIRWLLLTIYKIIGLDRISPQSVFGGVD